MSHDPSDREDNQDMNDLQISMPGFKESEQISQKDEISFAGNLDESDMGEENSNFWKSEKNEKLDDRSSQVRRSNQDQEEASSHNNDSSHDSDLERFQIEPKSESESAAKQEDGDQQVPEQENAEQGQANEEQKEQKKEPTKQKKENRFWEYRKKTNRPPDQQETLIPVYNEEERIRLSIESAVNFNEKMINNKQFVKSITKPLEKQLLSQRAPLDISNCQLSSTFVPFLVYDEQGNTVYSHNGALGGEIMKVENFLRTNYNNEHNTHLPEQYNRLMAYPSKRFQRRKRRKAEDSDDDY